MPDYERKRPGKRGANARVLEIQSLKHKKPTKGEQETEHKRNEDGSRQKGRAIRIIANA